MDIQNNNGQATGLSLLGGRGLHDYSVDIDNLEVRMDTAEGNIASNDTDISDHETRITAIEDVAGEGNHEDSHLVHTDGDQTITGIKTFQPSATGRHITIGSGISGNGNIILIDNVPAGQPKPVITTSGNISGAVLYYDEGGTGTPVDVNAKINTKADDSTVVHKTGNESIAGVKTFTTRITTSSIQGDELEITGSNSISLSAPQTLIESSSSDVRIQATAGDGLTKSVKIGTEDAEIASFKSGDIQLKSDTTITGNLVSSGTNASITATSNAGVAGEVVTLISGTSGNQTKLQMTDNLVKIGQDNYPDNLEVIGEVICSTAPTADDRLTNKLYVDGSITTAIDDLLGGASQAYNTLIELENELKENDGAIDGLLTAVDGKVSKSGDVMTGDLGIQGGNIDIYNNATDVCRITMREDSQSALIMEYNGVGGNNDNFFALYNTVSQWVGLGGELGEGFNFVPRNGRVGIGLSNPSEKLEVNGNAKITGDLTVDGGIDVANSLTVGGNAYADTLNATNQLYVGGSSTANKIYSSSTGQGTLISSPTGYNEFASARTQTANWIRSTGSGFNNIQANTGYNWINTTGPDGFNWIKASGDSGRNIIESPTTGHNVIRIGTTEKIKVENTTTTITNNSVAVNGGLTVIGDTTITGNTTVTGNATVSGDITLYGNSIKSNDDRLDIYPNINAIDSTGWIELRSTGTIIAGKDIKFNTDTDSSNYGTLRMTITENGNVEITNSLSVGGHPVIPIRDWEMDLSIQSNTRFYPVVFEHGPENFESDYPSIDFEIFGEALAGANSYNEQTIRGYVRGGGWSDHASFYEITSENYSSTEKRVSQIYRGNADSTSFAVYVRGGYKYTVRTNAFNVIQPYINPIPGGAPLLFSYVESGTTQYKSIYSVKTESGTDSAPFPLSTTPSSRISFMSNVDSDTKIIGSKTYMKQGLEVDGSITFGTDQGQINVPSSSFFDIAIGTVLPNSDYTFRIKTDTSTLRSNLSLGGIYQKEGIPLITQIHTFYQSKGDLISQWLCWSSVRDAVTDGVLGMKFPFDICPYSISVSAEYDDSNIAPRELLFNVIRKNSTTNNSNMADPTSILNDITVAQKTFDLEEYSAYTAVFDSPGIIPANTCWGVYMTDTESASQTSTPEIVVSIHCYQA